MTDHHHFSAPHVDNCHFKNPAQHCSAPPSSTCSLSREESVILPLEPLMISTKPEAPRSRWHSQILPINKIYNFSSPNCYIMFAARLIYGLKVAMSARALVRLYSFIE